MPLDVISLDDLQRLAREKRLSRSKGKREGRREAEGDRKAKKAAAAPSRSMSCSA